jgi:hypothetical protein
MIFVSFGKLVTPFFSRHRESKKGRTSEIVKRLMRTEGLAFPFGTEGWLMQANMAGKNSIRNW